MLRGHTSLQELLGRTPSFKRKSAAPRPALEDRPEPVERPGADAQPEPVQQEQQEQQREQEEKAGPEEPPDDGLARCPVCNRTLQEEPLGVNHHIGAFDRNACQAIRVDDGQEAC